MERSSIPSSSGQALGVSRAHVLSVRPAGFHPAWPTSRSLCTVRAVAILARLFHGLTTVSGAGRPGPWRPHLGNALHLYLACPVLAPMTERITSTASSFPWRRPLGRTSACLACSQHVPVTLNAFIVRPLASLCKRWGLKAHRPPIKDMPEYLFSPQAISGALSMLDVNSCWPSEGASGRKLTTSAPS